MTMRAQHCAICKGRVRSLPVEGGNLDGYMLPGTITVHVDQRLREHRTGAGLVNHTQESRRYCPICAQVVQDRLIEFFNFTFLPVELDADQPQYERLPGSSEYRRPDLLPVCSGCGSSIHALDGRCNRLDCSVSRYARAWTVEKEP